MRPYVQWVAVGAFTVLLAGGGQLEAAESKPMAAKNFALGRLLDEGERPLAGASIRATGISTGPSTSWGGAPVPGFPDHVLADTNGAFSLSRAEPFVRVQVHIEAPGVGSGDLWLDAGNVLTVIHLGPFEMAMPPAMHLPPARGLPGITPGPRPMTAGGPPFAPGAPSGWTNGPARPGSSSRSANAAAGQVTVRLCPFPPGQTHETAASPAGRLKLAGQVRTRMGEPLPAGLKVHVRSGTETEQAVPDREGRFAFSGVPAGQVTVWIEPRMAVSHDNAFKPRWTGWRLAASNRNRTTMVPHHSELAGLLEADKDDLLLVIEQAEIPFGAFTSNRVPDRPEQRPLWGAETSGPPFITVRGQVVDDRTGQPVGGVKVIPSRQEPVRVQPPAARSALKMVVDAFTAKPGAKRGSIYADLTDEQISTNGTFCVEFAPLPYFPLLQFEAAGYMPLETVPFLQSTNVVIRLKPGTGPSGVVLRADGQPATGASVVYVTGGAMVSVQNRELRAHGDNQVLQVNGPDGKFAFEPGLQPGRVVAADRSGWAEATLSGAGETLKLRLKPWAAVKGTLMTTNATPAAGAVLALTWSRQFSGGGTAFQEFGRTTTDANGGFEFQDVPPRRLELQRIAVRPGSNWGPYHQQTWLVPQAGVTNDLGAVVCDPPPPLLETLKRKLGL